MIPCHCCEGSRGGGGAGDSGRGGGVCQNGRHPETWQRSSRGTYLSHGWPSPVRHSLQLLRVRWALNYDLCRLVAPAVSRVLWPKSW